MFNLSFLCRLDGKYCSAPALLVYFRFPSKTTKVLLHFLYRRFKRQINVDRSLNNAILSYVRQIRTLIGEEAGR